MPKVRRHVRLRPMPKPTPTSGTGLPSVGSQVDRRLMVVPIKNEFGVASLEQAPQMGRIFETTSSASSRLANGGWWMRTTRIAPSSPSSANCSCAISS